MALSKQAMKARDELTLDQLVERREVLANRLRKFAAFGFLRSEVEKAHENLADIDRRIAVHRGRAKEAAARRDS